MPTYRKVVRDRIPELIRSSGGVPRTRRLTPEEFAAALGRKLVEEAREFAAAPSPEELADVLEVVHALMAATGLSVEEVQRVRQAKAEERGAFDERLLLESVTSSRFSNEGTGTRTWPDDWEERRAGKDCPMCAEGPTEVNDLGDLRILTSAVCDVYLRRTDIVPGYAVVVWRGRHVAELTELSDAEAAEFERSVRTVSRALEAHFRPAKLNFLALGNTVPHFHAHIVPRYLDGPDPGRPPRFMIVDPPPGKRNKIPEDVYLADVAALRQLVEDFVPTPRELLAVERVALGSAAAIFDHQGRVLLVRHGYGRQNWELPGGGALVGESPEQTVVREVAEETGLTVVPQRITGVYPEPRHRLGPALHFVLVCRRELADAEPRTASDEIIDVTWAEPSELPRPISDFTVRRINDAMASGPLLPSLVSERVWFEDESNDRLRPDRAPHR